MIGARLWQCLRLIRMLSLVLLILTGCGGSGGTNTRVESNSSSLVLRLTLPERAGAGSVRRALVPAQTRQEEEEIASIDITVTGSNFTRTVTCFPASPTEQCTITETPEAFIVDVTIESVPRNVELLVSVSVFNSARVEIFRGTGSVTATQPTAQVTIPLEAVGPPLLQANAGLDQTASVGETVFLRGDASTNRNGNVLTFTWSFLSIPPGSATTLSDPTAVNPSFAVDQPGNYVLSLVVNDGLQDSAPAMVIISTVNSAPVADAEPDQTVAVGDTAFLYGGDSIDVDGDRLLFTWSFVTLPTDSRATLFNANTVTPSFVVDFPGDYIVQLIVNDGSMDSKSDTVLISTVNSAPIAESGLDQTVAAGNTVTLDGNESFDPDGNPLTFIWDLIARPGGSTAALSNDGTATPSFVVDVPGTYVVQLIVNDGTTDSEPDTLTISTVNSFPEAEAGPPQVVALGDTVGLDGSASFDAENDPLLFFWSLIVVPPGSTARLDNPFAVTPSFVADQPGDYVAQLIIFDGSGRPSDPDTVLITVPRGIELALAGISGNVVVVGMPATLLVTLPEPAPPGGVTVTVTSDAPGVIAIDAPGTVFINGGTIAGQIGTNVLALGSTTIRAAAPGFLPGTLPILVVPPALVTLPTTLNVAPGQTMSVPVTLASGPAPPGGVLVDLLSSDPSVQVLTPTVMIPAGAISANGQVRGVSMGSATITGRAGGVPIDSTQVTIAGNLGVQSSASLDASFPIPVIISLESNGRAFAAPPAGIAVTLAAADPGCVAVTSPVTIAAGLVNTMTTLSYGNATALPCSTTVTVSAPNLPSADINVTVAPVPSIVIFPAAATVGAGLQVSIGFPNFCCTVFLGSGNHGGVTLHLESSDPSRVLLAPDGATAGTGSVDLVVPPGQTFFSSLVIQGMEGTSPLPSGPVTVTASAPGFLNGAIDFTVVEPVLRLTGLPANTTALSGESEFGVEAGVPFSGSTIFAQVQQVRVGSSDASATITSDTPTVGLLHTTAAGSPPGTPTSPVTVPIVQGQSRSPSGVAVGGVAFVPEGGSPPPTTVTATLPGLTTQMAAQGVTVAAMPTITIASTAVSNFVGAGLQVVCCTIDLGASFHGGVTVRIQSNDPARVLVAPDAATAGAGFFDVVVLDGQRTLAPFVVQGVEGTSPLPSGPVTISVFDMSSPPLFVPGSIAFTVVEPVLRLSGLVVSTTVLSGESAFGVEVGVPFSGTTIFAQAQQVRVGSTDATATVTSDTPAVGLLRTTADGSPPGTPTSPVTAPIAQGQSRSPFTVVAGGVAFVPVGGGTTTVNANIPGLTTQIAPPQGVTVNGTPPLSLFGFPTTLGEGLQAFCCSVNLGVAQHGGVTVRLTSGDPAMVLLAPNLTTTGNATLDLFVPNGQSLSGSFVIQAVEGAGPLPAQVALTASAPGFTDATPLNIMVVQAELRIFSAFLSNLTTLSGNRPFEVQVGVFSLLGLRQEVRSGGTPLAVVVTNSNAGTGQLVTSSTIGQTAMVTIPVGQSSSSLSVALGGVAFDPLTTGDTTLMATAPNVATAMTSVLMTATPGITLFSPHTTVGAGLQAGAFTAQLGASDHGGVTLHLESSNPAVALVSPNATTPGTAALDIFIPNGSSNATYFVQGMEGAMGSVAVVVSAPGFIDNTAVTTVVPPALQLLNLPANLAVAAADMPFQVFVGTPNFGLANLGQFQDVRAGGNTLTITITSDMPGVGQLVTSGTSGGTVTVQIPPGMSSSPFSVATGGLAFDALTTGSTEVRVVSPLPPGFLTTGAAAQRVNVVP